MDRPVHRGLRQVEAHDAVIGAQSLIGQRVEHPRVGPLVAARPQSSVRRLVGYQALRGDPRASRDQPDHDPLKAHPVRDPRIVTAQRMIITTNRQQRLRRRPHRIHHLRVQRAHNDRNLHLVVVVGAPESPLGTTRRPVDGHLPARPLSLNPPTGLWDRRLGPVGRWAGACVRAGAFWGVRDWSAGLVWGLAVLSLEGLGGAGVGRGAGAGAVGVRRAAAGCGFV